LFTELTENEYAIGRGEECTVRFTPSEITEADLELISRTHCKISKTPTEVYLEDFSRNGTYVNRKKVRRHKRIILKNNDEISLGSPEFRGICVNKTVT